MYRARYRAKRNMLQNISDASRRSRGRRGLSTSNLPDICLRQASKMRDTFITTNHSAGLAEEYKTIRARPCRCAGGFTSCRQLRRAPEACDRTSTVRAQDRLDAGQFWLSLLGGKIQNSENSPICPCRKRKKAGSKNSPKNQQKVCAS